jgi:hypothetical protein
MLALVTGATVLAQRSRFGTGDYSMTVPYDGRFVFVRMSYPIALTGGFGFGRGRGDTPWAHDYPTGEQNFMQILTAVSNVAGHVDESNVLDFSDPQMFKFPVIYLVEPGYWVPNDEQVVALRSYLDKGGFLIVDDFPYWAWANFDEQMSRVFPQGQWRDLDVTHPTRVSESR